MGSSSLASVEAPAAATRLEPEVLADLLVEVGAALVRYGCPSYRLEEVIGAIAEGEGMRAESFALPTGVFLNVLAPGRPPVHRMARVKEWTLDLGRLTEIDAIFDDVSNRRIGLAEGLARVRALDGKRPPYPAAARLVAPAAIAGSTAIFLGGGALETGFGAISGLLIGLTWLAGRRWPRVRLLGDLVGAMVAALVAWTAVHVRASAGREVIALAGVILLVPGMTFTTGLAELVNKNLVSGASRLMEAFVTLLSLVFGVGAALVLERWLPAPSTATAALPGLALPWQLVAVVAAGLGLAVHFSVPRRFVLSAIASALVGWTVSRVVGARAPAAAAAFASSLAVCLYANALARGLGRPAQLFQLPGMTLLVPGSFGFISFSELVRGELAEGAQRGISMVLVGGALVMGVLVANVLLRPRKLL
jgi:uncharacterized membrane protein YjjP (DUF1212 family)